MLVFAHIQAAPLASAYIPVAPPAFVHILSALDGCIPEEAPRMAVHMVRCLDVVEARIVRKAQRFDAEKQSTGT